MTAEAGWLLAILDKLSPRERDEILRWVHVCRPAFFRSSDGNGDVYDHDWLDALPDPDEAEDA